MISNPIGSVLGYALGAASQETYGWRWAFFFQCVLLLFPLGIIFFTEDKYFKLSHEEDIENKKLVSGVEGEVDNPTAIS